MATLETRDFLGMLDHPHYSSSSSSSSSSPALQVSLRATEYSDSSINAERVPEGGGRTTDCSATYKRKRSAEQTVMHGGNGYGYPALHLLMVAPLRNSVTPRRIPIARKASLARFFQMRNHRVQKLRLDGHNSSMMDPTIDQPHCPTLRLDGHNDQSVTFMEAKSGRKNAAIPSHTEIELIYSPSINIMP